MTASEVKTNILQAKDQRAQIKICAELNAVSEDTIKKLLREQGVKLSTLKGSRDGRKNSSPKSAEVAAEKEQTVPSAFAVLISRVAELIKQKQDIDDELSEINLQLNRIEDIIAGGGVRK